MWRSGSRRCSHSSWHPEVAEHWKSPQSVAVPALQVPAPSQVDAAVYLLPLHDDAATPTRVVLCPSICSTIQADPKAVLNVGFACEPVITVILWSLPERWDSPSPS